MKEHDDNQRHYGVFTAIAMIVGICIGSGIFFKADNILTFTGGNVALGVLVLCIGAFSIIFGSVSMTEFATRTNKSGGLVAYFEDFISPVLASGFGWFQTFLYYPTITAIVSWAAGIYTCSLLNIDSTLENQVLIGAGYLLAIYIINIISYRFGGVFQNITTVIKLIPLLGIGLIGFFWSKDIPDIPAQVEKVPVSSVGWGWIAALTPVAFSYDGWPIATTISPEVKNPKKNMTIALTIGPLIVLFVYVAYFLGINKILGPEYILSMGDQSVFQLGNMLFGSFGGKLMLIFVIISVLGVINGITLAGLRMPYSLAVKNMLPYSKQISKINEKSQLSYISCFISFFVTFFWLFIHYVTQKSGILGKSDISEIAIVFGYLSYLILYIRVIQMRKQGIVDSNFKGIVAPILGMLGSFVIIFGALYTNPFYVTLFIFMCLCIFMMGSIYYKRSNTIN